KQTKKAKKVKNISIDFTLDAFNATDIGNKNLFVILIDPDGNTITPKNIETFSTKSDEEIVYTEKLAIDYKDSQPKLIKLNVPLGKGQKGTYTVQVYYNGEIISDSQIQLK
ncbi:MAG: hypothetical protein ORN85_08260, partial [Sediminibacterium sp.]|nr:hypothetical protein [Sediminibacterium sp.]